MTKVFGKLISIVLCLLAIILFIVGLVTQSVGTLSLAAFCAWGMAFFAAMSEQERNIIYIFFLITFFIFLLSRVMVRWIESGEVYTPFSIDVMVMIYTCFVVSLFGLTLGSKAKLTLGSIRKGVHLFRPSTNLNMTLIRQISGIFTVVAGFANMIVIFERIAFWGITRSTGDIRVSFSTSLPTIVLRISYVYVIMLCIYLATMPEKRKCLWLILQFLICGALKMIYGSRSDFILGLMFVLVYFLLRDKINEKNGIEDVKWYGKKELAFTIASIPLLIVLVVFIGYYRTSQGFHFSGFRDTLFSFFDSQGTTINVVGYTKVYEEGFTQPKFLYLFDRTYELLTTNPISKIFTRRNAYSANTIERAKYGTSLGMTLSYQINPTSYLTGHGCGSSYVAEGWLGYGYVGLFFINFVLAQIMQKIDEYDFSCFIPSVIILVYIQSLFAMPRAGFDTFVDDICSITNIFGIFVLWIVYKMIKHKSGT